jgi:hypothetical protein
VLKEPYSDNTIERIENGKTIYVAATYEDENGDVWGYAENEDIIGWFRMSELQLVYDHDAFRKEHESELEYFDRKLYNDLLDSLFIVWSYPGSDKKIGEVRGSDSDNVHIRNVYTDEEGKRWLSVTCLSGSGWFCLDSPEPNASAYPAKTDDESMEISKKIDIADVSSETSVKAEKPEMLLTIVLVIAVVIGTAVLIYLFWRRDKKVK